jgi:hypothetical protein
MTPSRDFHVQVPDWQYQPGRKGAEMQTQIKETRSFTFADLCCVEAVLWELRKESMRLQTEYPRSLSTSGPTARGQRPSQGGRQFLILDRRDWTPMASFGLRESWCPDTGRPGVETEFDLREMIAPGGRYLELDGPGLVSPMKMETVLAMAMSLIRTRYQSVRLAGIVSRISLPLWGGDSYVQALIHSFRNTQHGTRKVAARVALRPAESVPTEDVILPPVVHAWLQQGACIGNEVYWDAEQGQARILIWMPVEQLWHSKDDAADWSPVDGGLPSGTLASV